MVVHETHNLEVGGSSPPPATMNFSKYQSLTQETAIYPGQGQTLGLAYVGLGLGEAGEAQGNIKKIIRDDGGIITPTKRDALKKELGDILWYVAQTATEAGISLEDVAVANIAKLQSRKERGVIQGSGDNR